MAVYVGVAGWSYPDWEGVVYPEKKNKGFSGLSYLSQYIDAMELNVTFYRPPSARMAAKWVRNVEAKPDFTFTAKLLQRFTHDRQRPWSASEVNEFKDGLRPLQEAGRFAALLLQFPHSFKAADENYQWIARLSETFAEFPRVLEVRHASWDTESSRTFLRNHDLNFCNIDQPHLSACLRETNITTGPVAYYRFHGRNCKAWFKTDAGGNERYNYLYKPEEMTPWAERIEATASEIRRVFVIYNNHYQGQAMVNALQMKSQLAHEKVAVPLQLRGRYPVLDAIALPVVEQATLFQ